MAGPFEAFRPGYEPPPEPTPTPPTPPPGAAIPRGPQQVAAMMERFTGRQYLPFWKTLDRLSAEELSSLMNFLTDVEREVEYERRLQTPGRGGFTALPPGAPMGPAGAGWPMRRRRG